MYIVIFAFCSNLHVIKFKSWECFIMNFDISQLYQEKFEEKVFQSRIY